MALTLVILAASAPSCTRAVGDDPEGRDHVTVGEVRYPTQHIETETIPGSTTRNFGAFLHYDHPAGATDRAILYLSLSATYWAELPAASTRISFPDPAVELAVRAMLCERDCFGDNATRTSLGAPSGSFLLQDGPTGLIVRDLTLRFAASADVPAVEIQLALLEFDPG